MGQTSPNVPDSPVTRPMPDRPVVASRRLRLQSLVAVTRRRGGGLEPFSVPAVAILPKGPTRVKRLSAMAILLATASAALGQTAQQGQRIHPAVVRIIATENSGASSAGSGTLIGVSGSLGLVVTNWHVVRDATGPIMVIFPDGFTSTAEVLRTDRDWDLAALAIDRPNVRPVPLATAAPRPGELLAIAGYGTGQYRATVGQCTQYVSPASPWKKLPFEIVELSTTARQGDSGGPILNRQGELAGVLFGSGGGNTMGSYCGRVRWFLDPVIDDFQRLPPPEMPRTEMIAQRPRQPRQQSQRLQPPVRRPYRPPAARAELPEPEEPTAAIGRQPSWRPSHNAREELLPRLEPAKSPGLERHGAPTVDVPSSPDSSVPCPARSESIKTILALIGVVALLYHGLRIFGAAAR